MGVGDKTLEILLAGILVGVLLLSGCANCGLCQALGICPRPTEKNDANDIGIGISIDDPNVWLQRRNTERQVQPSP